MKLHIKLKDVLIKRKISQKQLAEMSGLRPNVISEIINNHRTTINKEHLVKICVALGIDKLDEILEIIE